MLPKGWVEATIAELTTVNPKHPSDTDRQQSASFIPMPAVNEHLGAITDAQDRTLGEIWTGYTHFADGDVIFAKITPCMENGKAAIASGLTNGIACGSTEFYVFRPDAGFSAAYLWRFLRQRSFREQAEKHMSGAVGQRRVPRNYLEDHLLPLPPAAEQHRIVAKLDALTTRLARARAELDRVNNLAIRLRYETLRQWFNLAEARRTDVPIATIDDVTTISSGFGFPKHLQGRRVGQIPFAKVSDISKAVFEAAGRLGTAANFVDAADLSILKAKPIPAGSTIFAKIGEALHLNRRAISQVDIIIDNNCMALSPKDDLIDSEYLFHFMRTVNLSPFAVATAIPSVRRGDVASLELPLPSLIDQRIVARKIRQALARADRLEAEAARARALLDRLEAAILAKAFRGELVPQDPNDEPASVLLDRVRAQRATAPKAKRGRRKAVGA